jgi:hypothetical protein
MASKFNDGSIGETNMMVDTSRNYQPMQNVVKQEKSIKFMQQKGIAGRKPFK